MIRRSKRRSDLLELARASAAAPSCQASRQLVLAWLRARIPHDAAIFHALSPRVPLTTAAVHGVDLAHVAASQGTWDDLAVELGALRELANKTLAASLDDVFPLGSRAGKRARQLLLQSFGMRSLCIVHLVVRERVRAAVILLAKRSRAFDAEQVARLRALAPLLAVCDALHEELDDAPRTAAPVRLRCRDTRLTERQRQIVEHVALGHRNADIAEALGVSANTIRNTLARIFARVGASNRADLMRLAVLGQ
jgi:DNA-binding CsgD family transcriptional regulator